MKNIIILGLICILIAGCNKDINSFRECVDSGNPILESYPRQCKVDDKTFTEDVNNTLIGGDKDEYGCLIGAGYSWDEDIKACTRNWEIKEEDQKKAAKIVVEYLGNIEGLTMIEVESLGCSGCFMVSAQLNDKITTINIIDWKISEEKKKENFCSENSKKVEMCIEIYKPVCGWYDSEKIQCVKYPCAKTFSNDCFACMNENVKYWTEGSCPS